MNESNFWHGFYAVTVQLMLLPFLGPFFGWAAAAWIAALGPIGFFLGLEVNQHTYRAGGPKETPWHYGFIHGWNEDSIFDLAVPVLFCLLVALCATLLAQIGG